jgi:L-ascorbate metabolism protein UlaG (beta-lactamase superfamily)
VKIRYVANACYLIELATGEKLLTDPWFDGPCQQTWWNFPPVPDALKREIWASRPDLIYVSHLHHDHLHPQTLAPFDRTTPVVIGKMNTPNLRNAIAALGFTDIQELAFETRVPLGRRGAECVLFSDFHGNTLGDHTQVEYDLDTSMYLFDVDGTAVFNAVDNTILPADGARIAADHGRPRVAMLPYASASLFPMAMADYPDARKQEATAHLRRRTAANFRGVFEALRPERVIPAGGEYVLGGPAAPLSRFLPQPLEAALADELAGIGRRDALAKLHPGDLLDTDALAVTPDPRADAWRGFTDEMRAAYALTLEGMAPSFTGIALPPDLPPDWGRMLKKCAANYAARRAKMDLSEPLDVFIDARGPDHERRFLFGFALDSERGGFATEIGAGRAWLSYQLDERLLFALVAGLLSWNAMEASALIAVRREPDTYAHDLHRSMVHFTLVS